MNSPKTEIAPSVIFIACNDWDELENCVRKGIADGYYGIGSAAGLLLIKEKERAFQAFATITDQYLEHMGMESTPITSATSESGLDSVAIGMNTPEAAYLYGTTGVEYMDYVRSIQRGIPEDQLPKNNPLALN